MTRYRVIVAGYSAALLLFCADVTAGEKRTANADAPQDVAVLESIPAKARTGPQQIALGRAYYQAGRLDEAYRQAATALEASPDDADALSIQGDVWRERGDWARALEAYARAARAKPDRADIELLRGQALMELGRTREADLAFDRYRALSRMQPAPTN